MFFTYLKLCYVSRSSFQYAPLPQDLIGGNLSPCFNGMIRSSFVGEHAQGPVCPEYTYCPVVGHMVPVLYSISS